MDRLYVILADIHGNWVALDAVEKDARAIAKDVGALNFSTDIGVGSYDRMTHYYARLHRHHPNCPAPRKLRC
jgi:hypothetical protein